MHKDDCIWTEPNRCNCGWLQDIAKNPREAAREIERLRAELAECRSKPQDLYLHANGDPIDCRTCAHVYTDMESYGCKRSATIIVCVNGDGHVPADPVRLYETGGKR